MINKNIEALAEYYSKKFPVLKNVDERMTLANNDPVLNATDLLIEYRNIVPIMRDRYKDLLLKNDKDEIKLNRLRLQQNEEGEENAIATSLYEHHEGEAQQRSHKVIKKLSQRQAWMDFLSLYSETHPNMAVLARIMLVHITSAADADIF